MILNGTLISLQAVLAGAVATLQPECHVAYVDYNKEGAETPPAEQRTALSSTTDVIILAAPPFNPTREVKSLNLYNKDTASVTVTIKTDDGTTERILIKATLLTLECLGWEKGRGWFALDANGNLKEATSSLFSSLTVTGTGTFGALAVGSGTSGNIEAKKDGGNAAITGGLWNTGTNTNDDVWFGFQTNTSRTASIGIDRSTTLFTVNDGYMTAGTPRVTIDPLNGNTVVGGTLAASGTIKAGGYTVATLPANAAGLVAYVTDQLTAAAAKGVAPTGGGAVTCYVMNTGAGWVGI